MNLRSLQTRILSLLVLLTLVVQAGGFVLINKVGLAAARKTATEGLRVVAEGVEHEATLDQLRALGCDAVQGFFLARPMALNELVAWLRARSSPAARAAGEPPGLRRVV